MLQLRSRGKLSQGEATEEAEGTGCSGHSPKESASRRVCREQGVVGGGGCVVVCVKSGRRREGGERVRGGWRNDGQIVLAARREAKRKGDGHRGNTHKVIKGMHGIESGTENKGASKPCEARASKIGEGGKQQTSRSSSSSSSLSFLPGGQARELAFARPRRGPIDYQSMQRLLCYAPFFFLHAHSPWSFHFPSHALRQT